MASAVAAVEFMLDREQAGLGQTSRHLRVVHSSNRFQGLSDLTQQDGRRFRMRAGLTAGIISLTYPLSSDTLIL